MMINLPMIAGMHFDPRATPPCGASLVLATPSAWSRVNALARRAPRRALRASNAPAAQGRRGRGACPCYHGQVSKRAFTLIELVVTIVIIGIMAVVTVQYLSSAAQVYARLLAQRQTDSELLDAVERMRREARTARATLTNLPNGWTFDNAQGETKSWRLTGRDATLNGDMLAQGVDRFAFQYFDTNNATVGTNRAAIDHVELSFKVTNGQAASEMIVNFFLRGGFRK